MIYGMLLFSCSPDSSSHGPVPVSAEPWTLEQFRLCLQSIRVINTELFGVE